MVQVRKKLSADEQGSFIEKIMAFKNLHERISLLERKIAEIQSQKEMLLLELDLARADENMALAGLEMKYGPGRLDVRNMEWVEKNDEQDEYIKRI